MYIVIHIFNVHAEYIMQNAGLDESQAGIKIAGRNINNLRYANDNTLMARKWRETKELLDKDERGEWKAGLKLNIQKTKIVQLVATVQFSSVQFSRSVMSNSLRPHESQHTRLPCPSPIPGVHSGVYADYIMRNAGLEEAQAGIKIAGRNINNLR